MPFYSKPTVSSEFHRNLIVEFYSIPTVYLIDILVYTVYLQYTYQVKSVFLLISNLHKKSIKNHMLQ